MQRTPKLTWIGGVFFFDDHNEGQVEITVYRHGHSDPARFATIGTQRLGALRPGHLRGVEPRVADGRAPVHGRAEGSRTTPAGSTGLGRRSCRSGIVL